MFSFYFIFLFFIFLYINFQRVLKGMKGEHILDNTGDAKDTGAKKNGIRLNKKKTILIFFKEMRLISLQAIGLNTCEKYLRNIF